MELAKLEMAKFSHAKILWIADSRGDFVNEGASRRCYWCWQLMTAETERLLRLMNL